jgi:hypothetical protein
MQRINALHFAVSSGFDFQKYENTKAAPRKIL